ncbi:MAG: hypothetical protein AAFN79_17455 [Pseudomonadota bacterium]
MRYELKNVMVTSYQTSGSADAADSFDFTNGGETEQTALLLPAVQAAKEAARPTSREEGSEDSFDFAAPSGGEGETAGLLLPAVQLAHEKGRPDTAADHDDWIPILDISEGTHKPSSSDAAVLDFELTGNPDFVMEPNNWMEIA